LVSEVSFVTSLVAAIQTSAQPLSSLDADNQPLQQTATVIGIQSSPKSTDTNQGLTEDVSTQQLVDKLGQAQIKEDVVLVTVETSKEETKEENSNDLTKQTITVIGEDVKISATKEVTNETSETNTQVQTTEKTTAELPTIKSDVLASQVKALMGLYYLKSDGIPAEVLPGFYLGSIGAAFNKKVLEEHKIEHILCCCAGVKEAYPTLFTYKMLKLLDKPTEDITQYFEDSSDHIHDILSKGQKVLVHCFAGKSRSTTIMMSYLIKYKNMTVDEALALIRTKRPVAAPNMGFLKQLRDYEKKVKELVKSVE